MQRFVVIEGLFDLEIHQGQQCRTAADQVDRAIEAQGAGFGLFNPLHHCVAQQQCQRQHARHDVGWQLALAQAEQPQWQQQP